MLPLESRHFRKRGRERQFPRVSGKNPERHRRYEAVGGFSAEPARGERPDGFVVGAARTRDEGLHAETQESAERHDARPREPQRRRLDLTQAARTEEEPSPRTDRKRNSLN